MKFVNIINSGKNNVFDLRVKLTTGEDCYYFFKVYPDRKNLFLTLLTKGNQIDLKKYGEVLKSGYGEPSEQLIKEMSKKYNLDY